jgi:copper chaperone CopZ
MDCLNPVEGITNIMVNVPLKQVIVDHAYEKIPTSQIQRVLNDNSFSATIVRDGGTAVNNNGDQNNINTKGRSRLYVSGICCPMEVPAVESILNGMGDGVYGHMINVTTKTVRTVPSLYTHSILQHIILSPFNILLANKFRFISLENNYR